MSAMHRTFLLLLFVVFSSSSASAFDPDGATAELTSLGGFRGFSLGLFGLDTSRSFRPIDDNQLQVTTAAIEASWSHDGFLVALSAGRTSYTELTFSGLSEWSTNFAGVRLEREIRTIAGGALAASFGAYQYSLDSDTWRELNFSLRWSRRF